MLIAYVNNFISQYGFIIYIMYIKSGHFILLFSMIFLATRILTNSLETLTQIRYET